MGALVEMMIFRENRLRLLAPEGEESRYPKQRFLRYMEATALLGNV
jgi:hypothetical protein